MADAGHMAKTWRNTRVINDVAPLDYGETLAFFEGRARRSGELDRCTITMYQDGRAELAAQRDEAEVETILPLLRTDRRSTRVLDVGCGVGRWGTHLADSVCMYTGVDFSEGLVALANEQLAIDYPQGRGVALKMSASEVSLEKFGKGSFDLIILSAIMLYLNDEECRQLLRGISDLGAPGSQIYIREPMARQGRLTLRGHWSDELSAEYSAVYRSIEQYRELIDETLAPHGHTVSSSFELSAELSNRSETGQFVLILDKALDA